MLKALNNEKTYKITLTLSILVFIFSLVSKFCLCGSITVKNSSLKDIYAQKIELEKEISKLSYIDSTMSSISYVDQKAKSLGFVEMNSRLLSLDPQAPVQIASISR